MPADSSLRPLGGTWWTCRIAGDGARPTRIVVVESTRYPNEARIELGAEAAAIQIGESGVSSVDLGNDGTVTRVDLRGRYAPKGTPLWFVELREPSARPPAVVLMAFTGAGQPSGVLLDENAVSNVAVSGDDQLGAVRWYPATGEVDQVYVQPQWRRRNVATALIAAATTIAMARGWPQFWGGGTRTEIGEQLRAGGAWHMRFTELTHLAPPMTPGENGVGAEREAVTEDVGDGLPFGAEDGGG